MEFEDAAKRFWILDKNGLITRKRPAEELTDVVRPFAAVAEDDVEGEDLLSVVKRVCGRGQCTFPDNILAAAIAAAATTAAAAASAAAASASAAAAAAAAAATVAAAAAAAATVAAAAFMHICMCCDADLSAACQSIAVGLIQAVHGDQSDARFIRNLDCCRLSQAY